MEQLSSHSNTIWRDSASVIVKQHEIQRSQQSTTGDDNLSAAKDSVMLEDGLNDEEGHKKKIVI
jgi:hypothetical protein